MEKNRNINTQEERPLITFALFAYNQEEYIREAIEGAFSQTYSPLEIILSDDCSTDRTFEIMERMAKEYQGPHTIILNRNNPNLGLCAHVNKVFELASAEIVVVAAGDDISFPDRVTNTWRVFDQNPNVVTVSMEYASIDTHGVIRRSLIKIRMCREGRYSIADYLQKKLIPVLGATRAYRKVVFQTFGPLSPQCYSEDGALLFRSLLIGTMWHQATKGVFYRVQDKSLSNDVDLAGYTSVFQQNGRDLKCAIDRGLVSDRDVETLRASIRDRYAACIIRAKFNRCALKIWFFFVAVLPSRRFRAGEKRVYLLVSLRQLLPQWVVVHLKRLRRIPD